MATRLFPNDIGEDMSSNRYRDLADDRATDTHLLFHSVINLGYFLVVSLVQQF